MCGIVGYVGRAQAARTLLDALSRLEYRGYDSAGVALLNGDGIEVRKRVGKLNVLAETLRRRPAIGQIGVGHCLSGDTLIQLADGRAVRIDSLEREAAVLALDPKTLKIIPRNAKVWAHVAPEQLVELQMPFGTIVCTPQHRLFTVGEDGDLIERRADAFRPEDCLVGACTWIERAQRSQGAFRETRVPHPIQPTHGGSETSAVATIAQADLHSDVCDLEILSVRRVPSRGVEVYDLEVEGLENFFANGILSHNSRWATHGEPSETNAHPHTDCGGTLAIVHNGIIENYAPLKDRLLKQGHTFRSKTDTEVIAHLIEEFAKRHPLEQAFRMALKELKGSYAVCLLSEDEPDRLLGARNGSPLIVGIGKGEALFASDVTAFLGRTKRVVYLNDREVVELTAAGPRITTLEGRSIRRGVSTVNWNVSAARKEGYAHFMLKEIHEQPEAIRQTLFNRLNPSKRQIIFDRRTNRFLARLSPHERFVIIACGTAYHAGLVGEYMLEEFAHIPVVVDLASEFRYRGPMLDRQTTVIAITQSGETADTLAGIRLAKEQGAKVLAVCNVMGSSIAREADAVLYTHAGPEIAVASTKAYTSQLTALLVLTLALAKRRKRLSPEVWRRLTRALHRLPEVVERTLATERTIKGMAARYAGARDFYFLGRRYNYPSALEGALKLKEICPQIHAEGYAAGEMKHGPISLIRKGWPVVFLATDSPVYEKVVSNIEEVRARKGQCIIIASEGDPHIKRHADDLITVPKTEELFSPVINAIPLQLFAYYVANANNCDVDQPPNLAKSVTVE